MARRWFFPTSFGPSLPPPHKKEAPPLLQATGPWLLTLCYSLQPSRSISASPARLLLRRRLPLRLWPLRLRTRLRPLLRRPGFRSRLWRRSSRWPRLRAWLCCWPIRHASHRRRFTRPWLRPLRWWCWPCFRSWLRRRTILPHRRTRLRRHCWAIRRCERMRWSRVIRCRTRRRKVRTRCAGTLRI